MSPWGRYYIKWKTLPQEGQENFEGSIAVFGDSRYDAAERALRAIHNAKFKGNPRAVILTDITLTDVLDQDE